MRQQLDPTRRGTQAKEFETQLRRKIVGQDSAVEKMTEIYQMFLTGLNPPGRPVGNLLFLGPTGTGKTAVVLAAAEALFGDPRCCLKIDCAEFQHSHEIAKIVGCFVPGTGVLMADGTSKPIEEIQVGDWVITKDGTPQQVTFLHKYEHTGEMVELNIASSNIPVVCTPQHEILAIKDLSKKGASGRPTTKAARNRRENLYNPEKLEWITASELSKGDVVVYPRQHFTYAEEPLTLAASVSGGNKDVSLPMAGIIGKTIDLAEYVKNGIAFYEEKGYRIFDTEIVSQSQGKLYWLPRFIKVDENFCRLAGFYVSEGGCHFTFGAHAQDSPCIRETIMLLRKIFNDRTIKEEPRYGSALRKGNAIRVGYYSPIVALMMSDLFGDYVLRKKLPEWFLKLEPKLLWNFLDTAFLGDGGKSVRRRLDYSTSSPLLASQLRLMIHNLGYTTQMQLHHPIDPRGLKSSPRYRLYIAGSQIENFVSNLPSIKKIVNLFNPGNNGIQRMSHVDENYVYFRIKESRKINYSGLVHDFSVPKNPSYVLNFSNITVKNSPAGYLGHRETHPMITQEVLNQWHTEELKLSILLFDEIEKASDSLWQLLLGIMDKATLTLGDNRRVDFSNSIIIMTSNLGATDMLALQEGYSFGFNSARPVIDKTYDDKIQRTAVEAARRKFTPEFMNRIDKTVVFNTLRDEHLVKILEIELAAVQARIWSAINQKFTFKITQRTKDALLAEGIDPRYGARHLKRAIERNIVHPLANLVATEQVSANDVVLINYEGELPKTGEAPTHGYTFHK